MDVGTARGQFNIEGLEKSIKDLKLFKNVLEHVSYDYKTHRKEQAELVKHFKQQSYAVKSAIRGEKYFAGSIKKATEEIKRQQTELNTATKLVQVHKDALKMSTHPMLGLKPKPEFNMFLAKLAWQATRIQWKFMQLGEAAKRAASGFVRITTSTIVRTLRDFYLWGKKGVGVLIALAKGAKRFYGGLKKIFHVKDQKAGGSWWARFGSVAAGFAVAYRAINAVEIAVSNLTQTFWDGLTSLDSYKHSLATISGMLALLSKGDTYAKRFAYFNKAMRGVMLESIRLAPMFKLSTEEIADAYKELSQFGVVLDRQMVKPTLTAVAAIKEIAVTTGSSSRQIRQEIQSIFNGQARVTDQFSRFAKRFPEIRKALFGINKLTTSNQEKWRLAIGLMEKYFTAIQEANKTIVSQYTISRNNLKLISMVALEGTGVYKKWLAIMTNFNNRLINAKGNLGDLGQKAINYFSYAWQLLSKISTILLKVVGHVANAASQWKGTIASLDKFRLTAIKAFGSLMVLRGGLIAFLGVGRMVFGLLLNKITLVMAGFVYGNALVKEFFNTNTSKLTVAFETIKNALKFSWELLEKIIIGYAILKKQPSAVFTMMKFRQVQKDMWDKYRINVAADSETIKKQIGEALDQLSEYFYELNSGKGLDNKQLDAAMLASRAKYKQHLENLVAFANTYKKKLQPIWEEFYGAGGVDANFKKLMGKINSSKGVEALKKHVKNAITEGNKDLNRAFSLWLKQLTGLTDKDLKIQLTGLDPKKWEEFFKTLNSGMAGASQSVYQFNQQLKEFKHKAKPTFEYVGDYFGKYVGDAIRGEINSLTDLINGFLTTIRDAFAQAFQDIATDMIKTFVQSKIGDVGVVGLLNGFFGGTFAQQQTAYAGTTGATAPSAAFKGLTTGFASGGILTEPVFGIGASGRTYTFAEQGPERIVPNDEAFGATNVTVNVINKSSVPVDAHIGDTRKQLRNVVTEIILEDRRRGGLISRSY